MCGFQKVVYTQLENMKILRTDTREDIKLPKRDTKLWNTLKVLTALEIASSAEVTQTLADLGNIFSVSDVSSYLTILRAKGLVEAPESRRGVQGGSTWNLTSAAKGLLGV
jgi:hypothetical protein